CLPMSLIATDITGNTVEETGLGYAIGDQDRICRPVPGSLRALPGQDRPMAQLLLSMEDEQGGVFAATPREVLRRVLQGFSSHGLTPVVAVELEFFLLDSEASSSGEPQSSINPATGMRNHGTQVYFMQDLSDYRVFLGAVADSCLEQRIPAQTAVSEYAPGQFEINLAHRDDALLACDDAVFLKRCVKSVAEDQGMIASFMAKPFVDQAGSGMHVHVSVLDANGKNIFAGTPQEPSTELLHGVGGLLQVSRDCMLIFAPHANSYRRFVANAFVPVNESWGFNNRTVAVRIPHGAPVDTRIEHRVAGADGNPYLVVAAVLAGILDGLESRADPEQPVLGNAYEQQDAHPQFWPDTIKAFLGSDWIARRLGDQFQHLFGQQKLKEMRRFHAHVTPLEYDWYLRQV
ncbi:MAG: glutamine synthetase family protein, partial [Arenimonas sp.]